METETPPRTWNTRRTEKARRIARGAAIAHGRVVPTRDIVAFLQAVIAPHDRVFEKTVSNMQEVAARGAHVIAVAAEGDHEIDQHAKQVLRVPDIDWMLQPLIGTIPLQLLAYKIARLRGLNVDQPRNLAKTVTVE